MTNILGRPLREALSSLPPNETPPCVKETAPPRRDGQIRQEGTLRVVACREGVWIAARFIDTVPERKDET